MTLGSRFFAIAIATAIAAPAVAQDQAPQAHSTEKGKALYTQYCSHCHGLNMVSSSNAAFDLRQFPHGEKQRFFTSVTQGKNNRMPAWGDLLLPGEIDAIWAYVQTAGGK